MVDIQSATAEIRREKE